MTMNKLTFYRYAAIGMLLLNVAMLTFFFLTMPSNRPLDGPHRVARAEEFISLDEEQVATFERYAREHEEAVRRLNQRHSELLSDYFKLLGDAGAAAQRDTLLSEILDMESQKISITYNHFEDIRSMLRDDQVDGFEEFYQEILAGITGGRNRPERESGRPGPPISGSTPPR